jgi:hypothetical protein
VEEVRRQFIQEGRFLAHVLMVTHISASLPIAQHI